MQNYSHEYNKEDNEYTTLRLSLNKESINSSNAYKHKGHQNSMDLNKSNFSDYCKVSEFMCDQDGESTETRHSGKNNIIKLKFHRGQKRL